MTNDLDIYEFGRQLLETKDLDPVYVLLHEAGFDRPFLERWLLAYWCFYHVGTASWIAEQYQPRVFRLDVRYWEAMATAAASKEYPRSPERRHFRGENARKSVEWLRSKETVNLFSPFDRPMTVAQVMVYVQSWVGFGPWIAFKVADMLERLGIIPVEFDNGAMFLFDSPREGAELLWKVERGSQPPKGDVGEWAVGRILTRLRSVLTGDNREGRLSAPPRYERPINAQEAETILCKWKSYRKGHYHVGEDTTACRKGLLRFYRCKTAQRLLAGGKRGGLW